MADDWISAMPGVAPQAPVQHPVALRPLSLGEILDRIFSIYRSRFWLFAGMTSISAAAFVLSYAAMLVLAHALRSRLGPQSVVPLRLLGMYVGGFVFFLVGSLIQAATVLALSEVYLGREVDHTASVGGSLRATRGRWLRYLGIALWQTWSATWVMLAVAVPAVILVALKAATWMVALGGFLLIAGVLGGGIYGVIAYLRNAMAIQASVMEQLTVRPAMRRSKTLAKGAKGKLFVVFLIAGALLWVASMVEMPLNLFLMGSPEKEHVLAEVALLLVMFVSRTVVTPVGMIGVSLVYFDQRIRMEAFDLMMLLGTPVAVPEAFAAEQVSPVTPAVEAMPPESPPLPGDPNGDDGRS